MKKRAIQLFVIILCLLLYRSVDAETKVYVIVMGNNSAPKETALKTLRYADDDAVRYYNFFSRFSKNASLLTIPDGRTQRRYPEIGPIAEMPNIENLERVVRLFSKKIEEDKRSGNTTVLYFAFSGHGTYDEKGRPYLSLIDGGMDRHRLFDALSRLDADYTHLFIDACYAEGIVGARGMFDTEAESQVVSLSNKSVRQLLGEKEAVALPGLGVVMASSEHEKTHEWSLIESGVFTHEILSGLSGPADVNLDGKIEYSELLAFVASANRYVKDDRGRIDVVARPPERNLNVPIVDLNALETGRFLVGDVSALGHFHIELENGERYLDANLGEMVLARILVPTAQKAYLMSEKREAVLDIGRDRLIDVDTLEFEVLGYREKGSIETSFQRGLFRAEYGASYYRGFIDSTGYTSVGFDRPPTGLEMNRAFDSRISLRTGLSIMSFVVAGSAAAVAVAAGTLSLKKRREFGRTDLQNESTRINDRYQVFTAMFWPAAALVPIAAVTGFLLLPKKKQRAEKKAAVMLHPTAQGVMLKGEF